MKHTAEKGKNERETCKKTCKSNTIIRLLSISVERKIFDRKSRQKWHKKVISLIRSLWQPLAGRFTFVIVAFFGIVHDGMREWHSELLHLRVRQFMIYNRKSQSRNRWILSDLLRVSTFSDLDVPYKKSQTIFIKLSEFSRNVPW